jgi:pSer/pThr/pTyr-binding forkhead associated (FHA) protein
MSAKLLGRTGRVPDVDFVLDGTAHVGADPKNELCLPIQGVSRKHARLWADGPDFWIEDLRSTNGTYLNGQPVAKERLAHLDVITFGRDVDLLFLSRSGPDPSHSEAAAVLGASLTWDDGQVLELQRGETTLGRADANTVAIPNPAISLIHARLTVTLDQVLLEDLGSANGTFLNDRRLREPSVIETGDRVSLSQVAAFRMTVLRGPGQAPAQTTVASPAFDAEWKTRIVLSPDELMAIEAERARAVRDIRQAPQAPSPAIDAVPAPPQAPTPETKTAAQQRGALPIPSSLREDAGKPSTRGPSSQAGGLDASSTDAIVAAVLVGTRGRYPLQPGETLVGRAEGLAVRLDSPDVSRRHARIVVSASRVEIADLGSDNGTLVNGKAIRSTTELQSGDVIALGSLTLRLEVTRAVRTNEQSR